MTRARISSHTTRSADRRTVQLVVDHKVCCGCGACTVVCPVDCIEFIHGERYNFANVDVERCTGCGRCLEVCPSEFLLRGTDAGFSEALGPNSCTCYLAHAQDEQIRHYGASGGGITGLLNHLIRTGALDGAIVARTNPEHPLVSQTVIARDRDALLGAQGSRYTPVSNCMGLREVLQTPGRYALVGTPCMIQGATRAQEMIRDLRERLVLKIGLVCAGMASRLSTKAFLLRYGVDEQELRHVRDIRYRGDGWPGSFRVYGDNGLLLKRMLIGDSLEHLVPRDHYLRCWNCLDHWGRFADIVVSDPWCDDAVANEREGRSAMMVRTERGREVIESAIASGALIADPIGTSDMLGYNKHLVLDATHIRHSWMAVYQLVFFGRFAYARRVLAGLLRHRRIGLLTTLRTRLQRQYYY